MRNTVIIHVFVGKIAVKLEVCEVVEINLLRNVIMFVVEFSALFFVLFLRLNTSYGWLVIVFFLISAMLAYLLFKSRLRYEKKLKNMSNTISREILIFTVIKDDITAAKRFVEHYGNFPQNFHVLVFDDSSVDGTYEYLTNASKKFKNLEVRTLKRSERILHPKGEALEKALKENYDFIFLCDGDSLISLNDLNFLASRMEEKKLDYISAQRRNTEKERVSYYSADVNEIFMSLMNVLVSTVGGNIFPGSGHLFRRESFKDFKYESVCLSEDTYIGDWIHRHKKRGEKFYSVHVEELTPEKFTLKLFQMLKWTKNGIFERLKRPSWGTLLQYFLLFTIIFSTFRPHSCLFLVAYSAFTVLFGMIFGAALAFKKVKPAVIGFLVFSFEIFLSTLYNFYLYNKVALNKSDDSLMGNFERTKRE